MFVERQMKYIVYKAKVTSEVEEKLYIGATDGEWKKRYYNDVMTIGNASYKNGIIAGVKKEAGKQDLKTELAMMSNDRSYRERAKNATCD